jgi:hypothetical protein
VGPELVARQEAVPREVQEIAVAVAVPEGAVPVGRVVLAVDPEATVPRGPSGRAALSESWVNPE